MKTIARYFSAESPLGPAMGGAFAALLMLIGGAIAAPPVLCAIGWWWRLWMPA